MCLDYLAKEPFDPTIEDGNMVGWKVFSKVVPNHLAPLYQTGLHKIFPEDAWVFERDYRTRLIDYISPCSPLHTTYKVGFHLFHSKKEAHTYAYFSETVRKVYYRKPVAYGYQNGLKTIVAEAIFIIKEQGEVDE